MPNHPARPLDTGWFQRTENPWAEYHVVGGNGLMTISVEARGEVNHFIVDISFSTIPAYRGNLEVAEYEFLTHIPEKKAPEPPRWQKVEYNNPRQAVLSFLPSPSRGVTGYKLYRRFHSNDAESEPGVLVEIPAGEAETPYVHTLDLGQGGDRFLLSAVDKRGRESARVPMVVPVQNTP